jgi:hypothetical protein
MLRLQAVFPKDINEHTYDGYFIALKDYRIEYIEEAATHFMKYSRFFPMPLDFREHLGEKAWNDDIWKDMREAEEPTPTIEELLEEAKKHI